MLDHSCCDTPQEDGTVATEGVNILEPTRSEANINDMVLAKEWNQAGCQ